MREVPYTLSFRDAIFPISTSTNLEVFETHWGLHGKCHTLKSVKPHCGETNHLSTNILIHWEQFENL